MLDYNINLSERNMANFTGQYKYMDYFDLLSSVQDILVTYKELDKAWDRLTGVHMYYWNNFLDDEIADEVDNLLTDITEFEATIERRLLDLHKTSPRLCAAICADLHLED